MNRISEMTIDEKRYNTFMLTPCSITEFVTDIMVKSDTQAVLDKYRVVEVK